MTKVKIDSPGVTVEIEADDPLADVAARALTLFRDAGGWPQTGEGRAFGFTGERRPTAPAQPSSMRVLPHPYPVQGEGA